MGCMHSTEVPRPNLFQRRLCMHHKTPVTESYRVLGELGKGAFGIVEKVEHVKTRKHFAMKTVVFASGSKRHEFEREMDILRGLHHPNIVRMVETFEDDHHFYIIMELCTAGTLLDKVKARGKEFPENEVKEVIRNLASVVQYLHSRFICHRDLKLENILVEDEEQGGCIKLCDFGASTLFRMGVTMRKVLGSVVYMAPEVLEGNYTQTCDLWSLGVIMFMLLSNKTPFHGATEDELIDQIFAAKVTFDGPEWNDISADAKALIRKLLNPDPTTRYTATQALAHPWIRSRDRPIPPEIYDQFVPRIKAFCGYSPLKRAALVALAFCVSSAKIRQHSDVYNELNVAHNGILTLQELQQAPALKRFSLDLEKIYQAIDQKHEQGVNLLEFVAATLGPEDVANETQLRAAFQIMDHSQTGAITQEDLLSLLGQHFDAPACQDMVKRSDADRDGKIGFEDFVKMMKVPTRLSRHGSLLQLRRFSNPRSRSGSLFAEVGGAAPETPPGLGRKRHSASGNMVQTDSSHGKFRAEQERQEQAAAELQSVSKEEAVKKIQSFGDELAKTQSIGRLSMAYESEEDPGAATPESVHLEVGADTPASKETAP